MAFPVIVPGADGAWQGTTGRKVNALFPQLFSDCTPMFPPVLSKVTFMLAVPCPDTITAPSGTVQLYVTAPETGVMLYLFSVEFGTKTAFPEIASGALGTLHIPLE